MRRVELLELAGVLRIGDDRDAFDSRNNLLEQLHSLAKQIQRKQANARRVAARARKALDNLRLHRVAAEGEYDRCFHASADEHAYCTGPRHDDVGLRANDVAHRLLHTLAQSFAPPGIDHQVLTLRVAEIAHTAAERIEIRRGAILPIGGHPRHPEGSRRLCRGDSDQRAVKATVGR